ncbi:MAG TPA: DUF4252 domain-containing protein [Flavobacteriaceae bacterium]|nr:DUF4252 domain-containing protein [Flavobacteriaceae bacterium]
MKRTVQYILGILFVSTLFYACESEQTLQAYYVDNQETSNFMSVDIPPSIVGIDESTLTETQKKAFKSVKRLNFLGYKVTDSASTEMNTELAKIKTILKAEKYNDLIEFNDKSAKILVKYIGDDNSADEFVILGSNAEVGFGVVRVLGNNMKPEEMISLVDAMKNAKFDESKLQSIMNFYK